MDGAERDRRHSGAPIHQRGDLAPQGSPTMTDATGLVGSLQLMQHLVNAGGDEMAALIAQKLAALSRGLSLRRMFSGLTIKLRGGLVSQTGTAHLC